MSVNGYQISFFTTQDRRVHHKPVAEWLFSLCKELGLRGATVVTATEGWGHKGRVHSAHFFELADVPIEIVVVATQEEASQLFARIDAEDLRLFYVKTAVEFGSLGRSKE